MRQPSMICRALLMHWTDCACCLALARAGRSNAARIAIMAITTSNSIKVKPRLLWQREEDSKLLRPINQRRIVGECGSSVRGSDGDAVTGAGNRVPMSVNSQHCECVSSLTYACADGSGCADPASRAVRGIGFTRQQDLQLRKLALHDVKINRLGPRKVIGEDQGVYFPIVQNREI